MTRWKNNRVDKSSSEGFTIDSLNSLFDKMKERILKNSFPIQREEVSLQEYERRLAEARKKDKSERADQ